MTNDLDSLDRIYERWRYAGVLSAGEHIDRAYPGLAQEIRKLRSQVLQMKEEKKELKRWLLDQYSSAIQIPYEDKRAYTYREVAHRIEDNDAGA